MTYISDFNQWIHSIPFLNKTKQNKILRTSDWASSFIIIIIIVIIIIIIVIIVIIIIIINIIIEIDSEIIMSLTGNDPTLLIGTDWYPILKY